jgi:Ca2+-binding EF-hand superfamily protein
MCARVQGHVSRKEFRRAIYVLGYIAPAHDANVLFDEIDANGNGESAFATHGLPAVPQT